MTLIASLTRVDVGDDDDYADGVGNNVDGGGDDDAYWGNEDDNGDEDDGWNNDYGGGGGFLYRDVKERTMKRNTLNLEAYLPARLKNLVEEEEKEEEEEEEDEELKGVRRRIIVNEYLAKEGWRQMRELEEELTMERGKRRLISERITHEQVKRVGLQREGILSDIDSVKLCDKLKKLRRKVSGTKKPMKLSQKLSLLATKIASFGKKKFDKETEKKLKVLREKLKKHDSVIKKIKIFQKQKRHCIEGEDVCRVTEWCKEGCGGWGREVSDEMWRGREGGWRVEREMTELQKEVEELKEWKKHLQEQAAEIELQL